MKSQIQEDIDSIKSHKSTVNRSMATRIIEKFKAPFSKPSPEKKSKNGVVSKVDEDDDQDEYRDTWSGRFDFFLSALGYAVGLGAVWRFPYLCYKHGGGVFLIPYFTFLILVGIPLVFMELSAGQFTSEGPLTAWTMVPLFRGIGLSMNIVNGYLCIYYNMIIAYSMYFLVLSFTTHLPWQTCNSAWNVPNCVDDYTPGKFTYTKCDDNSTSLKCDNGKCFSLTTVNGEVASCNMNQSLLNQTGWWSPTFPSQIFWNQVILQKSAGIENSDGIVWQLVVALSCAWLFVLAMVVRGIKVSGKLVYFTSLFPYVVLLILGIRGWMLPGAGKGIRFYIYPEFSKLADVNVWSDAATQIFFTLSVSYGGLVALSSYNKFTTNVMRDAIVVSISNCLTSVFAGFVIFAYIGYLSFSTGQEIDQVIQQGQGLAFVVYPYAVTTIPAAPVWAILFFVMMLLLGLDTMMASVETTITSVLDIFTILKKSRLTKVATIVGICLFYYAWGFLFCLRSGTYWVEMFDAYSGGWAVLLVGALECISVGWFYSFRRFRLDISTMIGSKWTKPKAFYIWKLFWMIISPLLLIVIVALSFRDVSPLQDDKYTFPYWSVVLGQLITASTLSGVIIWAVGYVVYYLYKKKPLILLIKPDYDRWHPKKLKNRKLMYIAHGDEIQNEEKEKIEQIEQEMEEKLGFDNQSFAGEIRF